MHPFEAEGLGKGPFHAWADIRLPEDPTRRSHRVATEAARFRIAADDRCGCCRLPADVRYVLVDATERRNAAVCLPCLRWAGDAGLLRRAAHLDHEDRRKLERVTKRGAK